MMPTRPRQTLRFDHDWLFHRGDVPAPLANTHLAGYMANKAGWARGAARPSFDDTDWRQLDLPHDWAVEGSFSPEHHVNAGYLPRGVGWYRRHFRLDESERGRHLSIRFDGVATHCTVYVNGHLLHRHWCGYTPFTVDFTDVATFGDQLNVVAVRVDATYMEGWWYEGAGIYRYVWLTSASPVHVAEDGVFVRPQRLEGGRWDTCVETIVRNDSDAAVVAQVATELGNATVVTDARLPPRASATVRQNVPVRDPDLWSIESPNLHTVRTELSVAAGVVDEVRTTFGYRTIRFDADRGFFLNDRPLKLHGTCNHQDHAGVGVAVPDSLWDFRVRRLKEMGCNAIRTAHHPPAPELLDACDRLGMLVMDENRNFGSSPEHLARLAAMVRRDRNHPSVILWSLCNEEPIQTTPVATRIAAAMAHVVRQLDPTRPVTAAMSGGILNDASMAEALDVLSINYQLPQYDAFRAKHPRLPIVAGETHCALSTRGTYETDAERHRFASYDADHAPWGATARDTWRAISSRPWVAGLFAWTGFDHRGEPSPHAWPSVTSHWGILDLCGFPKDAFFLHKAWWTTEPFVHLLPHWTWPGKEGTPIRVRAYTNADAVELFLDGRSLGRKRVEPIDMVEWDVPYEPGALRAVALRRGEVVAEAVVETTGPAIAVGLEVPAPPPSCVAPPVVATPTSPSHGGRPPREATQASQLQAVDHAIPADGTFAVPATVFAVDGNGRRVPDADQLVTFTLDGAARIVGVGNGDPTSHEPDKASARRLFRGLAQVIVQTTTEPGTIRLAARASGLRAATLELRAVPAPPRPSVPPARRRHFVTNWRRSPITADRPDPNRAIADSDMNTWERIDPASGAPSAWGSQGGYALYRATFTPPKVMQSRGGRIVFHAVEGTAEVFVNGSLAASKSARARAGVTIDLPPTSQPVTLSVLVRADAAPAGLASAVELVHDAEPGLLT